MGSTSTSVNKWGFADDEGFDTTMGPATTHELGYGSGDPKFDDSGANGYALGIFKTGEDTPGNNGDPGRDKHVKPNKIYIGGLPEQTRQDDLRSCFGKIGNIVNIELKIGFGFVEFDSKEAAEESVAKYHEGFFMGNKIRVELSHNRGRAKRSDDPGACFRCNESGHWARECPRFTNHPNRAGPYEPSQHDRTHFRDHRPAPYRDEFERYPPPKDGRVHDYPPPQPSGRDYRRALTPPRDYRDPASTHLPPRRDYDDYRVRGAPQPPPAVRYDRSGYQGPDRDYPPRGQPPMVPAHRDSYDRRPPPTVDDRHLSFSLDPGRPRTSPGLPPTSRRDDYDRPSWNYGPPQQGRRRPTTPPLPYPHRDNSEGSRYRRRSLSPPPRYGSIYGEPAHYDGGGYAGPPRDGAHVRDFSHNDRGGDFGNRRP